MPKDILILYYTHSGNTLHVAKQIQDKTGGSLIKIEPVNSYPQKYSAVVELARKEIEVSYRPPIKKIAENMSNYDKIFIGSPNWCGTIAPPIATFLEEKDLTDKTIIPFITHGGGGVSRTIKDIKYLCKGAPTEEPLVIENKGDADLDNKISTWLSQIGFYNWK